MKRNAVGIEKDYVNGISKLNGTKRRPNCQTLHNWNLQSLRERNR